MKNEKLLKTNALVSIILIIGFTLTAIFSYRANYQASLDSIEQVSSLTTEVIYYQLTAMFTKPVNISLTMAHDSLLVEHLTSEKEYLDDDTYLEAIKTYLETYQKKYDFDSVFLVSTATGRYYNFNGVDRVLKEGDPENTWYYDLLETDQEYSLEVDNDEVDGADNAVTVFVNCKIEGIDGEILGVVGVGIRIDYLKELLRDYEDKYNVEASLISRNGAIEISTTYTGYEGRDWFDTYGQEEIREDVLSWKESSSNLELWASPGSLNGEKSYVVVRYIPEVDWSLLVERNTGELAGQMREQLYQTCVILSLVVLIVLAVITTVIRNFNRQITELVEEREASFKRATEQLYDNIYELNITRNCYEGKRTEEYFESLGARELPYDQGLRVIAEKQIEREYREGYVATFSPENVIREYEAGNNHLQYDFLISQDGKNYHWMRIDAYTFYSAEDESVHMFAYRKNIDSEKQRELQASTDGLTGLYNKRATEALIRAGLEEVPDELCAFFMFDIDNFKQVNDRFGHAFGDFCLREFAGTIGKHFREEDIIGRMGGDEFVAFAFAPDEKWVEVKAKELSNSLCMVCANGSGSVNVSASIGVAIRPDGGRYFDELYQHADEALYETKKRGKNGYTIYSK